MPIIGLAEDNHVAQPVIGTATGNIVIVISSDDVEIEHTTNIFKIINNTGNRVIAEKTDIRLKDSVLSNTLVVDNNDILVELEYIAGDTGITGSAYDGETVPYATQIDFITDNNLYIGEARPGSPTNFRVWRIKHIVFSSDGDSSIKWAGSSSDFTKIWDNRLSYVYK